MSHTEGSSGCSGSWLPATHGPASGLSSPPSPLGSDGPSQLTGLPSCLSVCLEGKKPRRGPQKPAPFPAGARASGGVCQVQELTHCPPAAHTAPGCRLMAPIPGSGKGVLRGAGLRAWASINIDLGVFVFVFLGFFICFVLFFGKAELSASSLTKWHHRPELS